MPSRDRHQHRLPGSKTGPDEPADLIQIVLARLVGDPEMAELRIHPALGQRHGMTASLADSAAIRELIHAHRPIAQRGGTLELTRPQPEVATVLEPARRGSGRSGRDMNRQPLIVS
jgi:hypothetical protein